MVLPPFILQFLFLKQKTAQIPASAQLYSIVTAYFPRLGQTWVSGTHTHTNGTKKFLKSEDFRNFGRSGGT